MLTLLHRCCSLFTQTGHADWPRFFQRFRSSKRLPCDMQSADTQEHFAMPAPAARPKLLARPLRPAPDVYHVRNAQWGTAPRLPNRPLEFFMADATPASRRPLTAAAWYTTLCPIPLQVHKLFRLFDRGIEHIVLPGYGVTFLFFRAPSQAPFSARNYHNHQQSSHSFASCAFTDFDTRRPSPRITPQPC